MDQLIYLQHVFHSSHNTVNYLRWSRLCSQERIANVVVVWGCGDGQHERPVIYTIFNSGITYDLSISINLIFYESYFKYKITVDEYKYVNYERA